MTRFSPKAWRSGSSATTRMAVVQFGLAISWRLPMAVAVHLRHHQGDVILQPQGGGIVHHRDACAASSRACALANSPETASRARSRLRAASRLYSSMATSPQGVFCFSAGAAGGGEEAQFGDREAPLRQHLHQFLADRARGTDHANPHDTLSPCNPRRLPQPGGQCTGLRNRRRAGVPCTRSVPCVDPAAAPCHLPCMSADPSLRSVKAWPFEEAAKVADRLAANPKRRKAPCSRRGMAPPACRISAPSGRWRAPPGCAAPSSGSPACPPAARLFGRHGRAAEGAGQRPEQGDAGRLSGPAADRHPRPLRHPSELRRPQQRAPQAFLDTFGFEYEFASCTDYYRGGRFDAALLRMAERHDAVRR